MCWNYSFRLEKLYQCGSNKLSRLLVAGGWKEAAEAGKLRIEGKNYLMQDGDVVEFRVGAQAK
jgi:Predicted GTPase, probable translation factor